MKTKLLLVVVAISCLSSFGHAQSLERYRWQPIEQITMQEIELMERSSHRSMIDVLNNAILFTVANNTIIIWSRDNVLGFYSSTLRDSQSVPASIAEVNQNTSQVRWKEQQSSRIDGLRNLFDNFLDISNAYPHLRPEDLKKADEIAETFFKELDATIAAEPHLIPNNDIRMMTEVFARRGNRYMKKMGFHLLNASTEQKMAVYVSYLEADRALATDMPSAFDRNVLFQKIVNHILFYYNEPILIPPYILDAMERETPDLYRIVREEIEKRGLG